MALTKPKLSQNIDTDISVFSDPILVLHQGSNSANLDVGFLMNRSNGLTSNAAVIWQESSKSFVHILTNSSGVADSNLAVQSYANVSVGNVLLINNAGIYVDGTLGSAGQVLASDGSKTYWAPPGGFTGGTVSGQTVFQSNLVISSTTSSTSNVTGALVVLGGVGVVGNVYANVFYIEDGIRWAGNGDVFASGSSEIGFSNIAATGQPTVTANALNSTLNVSASGGLRVLLDPSSATLHITATIDTTDYGFVNNVVTETANLGVVTDSPIIANIAEYGNVAAFIVGTINGATIWGNSIPGSRLISGTDINVGNITATSSITVVGVTADDILVGNITVTGTTTTGSLIPAANITYDLGTESLRWRDLYLNGSTIYLGAANISTDGSNLTMHNPQGARFTISGNSTQTSLSAGIITANVLTVNGNITAGNITANGNVAVTDKLTAGAVNNTGQFYYNSRTITANVTIGATENAMSVGPITIADGVEVVINDGGEWSIV